MSYRIQHKPPKPPNRTMQDTTTGSRLYIENGATAYFAIPCFYEEVFPPVQTKLHSRMLHDHLGYPGPDGAFGKGQDDHICQWWDFAKCSCKKGHPHYAPLHQRMPQFAHTMGLSNCGKGKCKDFIDLDTFIPIHFIAEGYEEAWVDILNKPEGLKAEAWIDPAKDWIIRVLFDAMVPEAMIENIKLRYTVRVSRIDGMREHRDTVSQGILTIFSQPIGQE